MSDSNLHGLVDETTDPLVLYTRSLHDYTLTLWTESRRVAEEKAKAHQGVVASQPATRKPQSTGGKERDPDQEHRDPLDASSSPFQSTSSDAQTFYTSPAR